MTVTHYRLVHCRMSHNDPSGMLLFAPTDGGKGYFAITLDFDNLRAVATGTAMLAASLAREEDRQLLSMSAESVELAVSSLGLYILDFVPKGDPGTPPLHLPIALDRDLLATLRAQIDTILPADDSPMN